MDGANAPKVLVREVEAPRALSFLEGLEVNVDEINYLANEIESLEEIQAEKLYAIISGRRRRVYREDRREDMVEAKRSDFIATAKKSIDKNRRGRAGKRVGQPVAPSEEDTLVNA